MHKWRVCSQHIFLVWILVWVGLLRWLSSEESTCNAGETRDAGSVPGSGRSSGGGNGNPLQYSCLATPRDRGAWQATVHGVTKSWTRLSDTHTHTHTHTQHCTFCPLTADNWLSWNAVTWEQGNVVFWIQSGDLNYRGWHPSLQKIVVLKFLRGRKNKEQKCRRN